MAQCPTCKAEIDHLIMEGNVKEKYYFRPGPDIEPVNYDEHYVEDRVYRCPECHDTLFSDESHCNAEEEANDFITDDEIPESQQKNELYIVIGVWAGCANEAHVFDNITQMTECRKKLEKEYRIARDEDGNVCEQNEHDVKVFEVQLNQHNKTTTQWS